MRTSIIGALSIAACLAAHTQTYDIDITMTGIAAGPITFSGSFAFDRTASGFCSAAFCAPGVTPRFADVLVSDPLSIDQPDGAFAFTLDTPLGAPAASNGLSDVFFATGGNATGMYSCGGPARSGHPGYAARRPL